MRGFEILHKFEAIATMPQRKTWNAAGYDIAACASITVPLDGRVVLVPTGLKAFMACDEFLQISLRSSLAAEGIIMPNAPAIIDADYHGNPHNDGHIFIPVKSTLTRKTPYVINQGDRIAQGVFQKFLLVDDDNELLHQALERAGGFGSTGR